MGARLVSLTLARWTHVSDRAFRVLVRMALTALDDARDDAPAATYFGGRELLAATLRSGKGTPESRYRVVQRVLAELTKEGAIQQSGGGRGGRNAVYRLTLESVRAIDERPSMPETQGGQFSHPQGGQISHPRVANLATPRVADLATPRNQEEPREELWEERNGDLAAAVTLPGAQKTAPPPPMPEPAVVVEIFPGAAQEARYRPTPRWSSRGADAIAEASARVAARKAAHRAAQEAAQ